MLEKSRKITVAIDCRALTRRTSGVGRYVANLIEGLVKYDDLSVCCLIRKDYHSDLEKFNARLVPLGEGGDSTGALERFKFEQFKLSKIIRNLNADVYHATWNYGIPWNCPCPSVLTLLDLLPISLNYSFGSRALRSSFLASQYLAFIRAKRILCISSATREALANYAHLFINKAQVVHLGVESSFKPVDYDVGTRQYLLYVGGREARKNIRNIFLAYERLFVAGDYPLALHFTGTQESLSVEDSAVLEALPKNVSEKINFVGFIPNEDMPALYQKAALLIFPSHGEGFGFPPLEAIACGTPVVTSHAGSIPEAVGNAALFVDPADVGAIAESISKILSDSILRARLISDGLDYAANMTWQRCIDTTANVYREVARKRS